MEESLINWLLSSDYWESDQSHVYHNTFSKQIEKEAEACDVSQEILKQLPAHLFFQTSGSTGEPKWIALSKRAMLASAVAVNSHLGIDKISVNSAENISENLSVNKDNWFLALPIFHVGGHALFARAYMSGGKVITMQGKWNAESFVEQLSAGSAHSTWVSLVPTQIVDIVQKMIAAPSSLKGCILGGGGIDQTILNNAQNLGWRVHQSYGMTEAASQIATAKEPGGALEVLPHISCKVSDVGTLQWTGESQFSGSIVGHNFIPQNGWVETSDKIELREDTESKLRVLKFIGRSDRTVKILGELVDVEALEKEINEASDQQVVISTSIDARRGTRLIPIVEAMPSAELYGLINQYKGIYQLEECEVREFRRSALGKIQH